MTHPLRRQAEDRADQFGRMVWVVEPPRGAPYIADRPDQIAPNYRAIWPVPPVTTASLR